MPAPCSHARPALIPTAAQASLAAAFNESAYWSWFAGVEGSRYGYPTMLGSISEGRGAGGEEDAAQMHSFVLRRSPPSSVATLSRSGRRP